MTIKLDELREAVRLFNNWVETRPKQKPEWVWWQGTMYWRQPDGSYSPEDGSDTVIARDD